MTEFPENPFPIGSRVRWDGKYSPAGAWVGVVTAHTSHKSVQCDGKGSIANGLLELVEAPAPEAPNAPAAPPVLTDEARGYGKLREQIETLDAANTEMAELIAQQCEIIAELQEHEAWRDEGRDAIVTSGQDPDAPLSKIVNGLFEQIPDEHAGDRIKEVGAFLEQLEAALEAYLSETHGASMPAHIPSPELRALAALIYDGV